MLHSLKERYFEVNDQTGTVGVPDTCRFERRYILQVLKRVRDKKHTLKKKLKYMKKTSSPVQLWNRVLYELLRFYDAYSFVSICVCFTYSKKDISRSQNKPAMWVSHIHSVSREGTYHWYMNVNSKRKIHQTTNSNARRRRSVQYTKLCYVLYELSRRVLA